MSAHRPPGISINTRFVYFEMNIHFFPKVQIVQSPSKFYEFINAICTCRTHHDSQIGSGAMTQIWTGITCQSKVQAMRLRPFVSPVILTVLLCFSVFQDTEMQHGKLIQHAEVRVLRIQGKTVAQIHAELVRLHGGHALSVSTVHRWFRKFQQGVVDFSVKKTGRCLTKVTPAKLDQIRRILEQDPTTCIRVIATQTGLSLRTIHHTLRNKMNLHKRPAKWIPHLLTQAQRDRRERMAHDLLARF